jgi:hypothetical protein
MQGSWDVKQKFISEFQFVQMLRAIHCLPTIFRPYRFRSKSISHEEGSTKAKLFAFNGVHPDMPQNTELITTGIIRSLELISLLDTVVVFPVRYEHYLHIKSRTIPGHRPWRPIGGFPARYKHHPHTKNKSLPARGNGGP